MAEVLHAASIQITMCDHGTVWISFKDPAGDVFAAAPLDPLTALAASEQIQDLLEAHFSTELAQAQAEGTA